MTWLVMATFGSPREPGWDGTRFRTVTGLIRRVVTRGFPLIRGDGCRTATDAGSSSTAVAGAGLRAHGTSGIPGRGGATHLQDSVRLYLPLRAELLLAAAQDT